MTTVGRLKKDGDFLISGELNEVTPAIKSGLINQYSFENGTNGHRYSVKGLRVLYVTASDDPNGYVITPWLYNNGAIMTHETYAEFENHGTGEFFGVYDLIVFDDYAWGSQWGFGSWESFIDYDGVSVIATGNDTRTNFFVKSYNASGGAGHNVRPSQDAPISGLKGNYSMIGSSDLSGGISELQNGARPLYYRTDNNLITGYYWESPKSNAVFVYDQEGFGDVNELWQKIILWAASRTQPRAFDESSTNYRTNNINGIAVEEGTTNLWTTAGRPGPSIVGSGGYCEEINSYMVNAPIPSAKTWRLVKDGTGNCWNGWESNYATGSFAVGDWFTVSGYYKSSTDIGVSSTSVTLYSADWSHPVATSASIPFVYDGDWHYFSATVKVTEAITNPVLADAISWGYSTNPGVMYINGLQWEKKAWPTSHIDGSRSNSLPLRIPVNTGSNFTIFYRFTPRRDWSTFYTSAYNRYVFNLYDKNTNKKIWWSDYHSGGTRTDSDPWIGFDEFAVIHWHNTTMKIQPNNEYFFALTKNGNTWSKYVYTEYKREDTMVRTEAELVAFSPSSIEFLPDFNHIIKEVLVYDRALSKDEILKLSNTPMSIQKNGDFRKGLKEKPNSVPNEAKYFPLTARGEDATMNIVPSTESNTYYKDGAVWLGGSYTNLYPQANSDAGFAVKGNGIFTVIKAGDDIEYRYNYNQNLTWTYHGQTIAITNGTTYRASMDVFISEDANIPSTGTTFVANMEGGCATSFAYDNTKKGTWQRLEQVVTATNTSTNYYLYPCTGSSPATTGFVKYKNVMLTTLSYTPAFVNGTRGYSRLSYTGSKLTKNNWQEFTLLFWAKYMDGGRWRLSGAWSRFYFGPDPNNRLSFAWNGYNGAGDTTMGQSNVYGTTVPIGQWTMLGVSVKNNQFIDIYQDGVRTCNWANPFELNSTSMDFEWNGLSPGDTSYPLNAYVRDAMFFDRALTPTEIQNIYKSKLRDYKSNKVQVQGQLREKRVL